MRNPLLEAIHMAYTGVRKPMVMNLAAYNTTVEVNMNTSQTMNLLDEVRFELRWSKIIDTRDNPTSTRVLRNIEHAMMADVYGPLQEPMHQLESAIHDNIHDSQERDRMLEMLDKMKRFTRV